MFSVWGCIKHEFGTSREHIAGFGMNATRTSGSVDSPPSPQERLLSAGMPGAPRTNSEVLTRGRAMRHEWRVAALSPFRINMLK